MKTKRSFKLLFALILALALTVGAAITASALEITNDITKVYVDVSGAEAGRKVNNNHHIINLPYIQKRGAQCWTCWKYRTEFSSSSSYRKS